MELTVDRDKDIPMPKTPELIIEALRALNDVQTVNYEGYSFTESDIAEEDQQGEPILDDEGNQIGTKDPETKKKRIKMSMNVKMEGAKTDFPEITSDKEAE